MARRKSQTYPEILGLGFNVFRVEALGFRIQGLGFRVQARVRRVEGLGLLKFRDPPEVTSRLLS